MTDKIKVSEEPTIGNGDAPTGRRFLPLKQAALYLGCSEKTLRNRYYARTLPFPVKRSIGGLCVDIQDLKAYGDSLEPEIYTPRSSKKQPDPLGVDPACA